MTNDIQTIRLELKKLFKGYRTMTKSLRKQLKKLGLLVITGRKHYKLFTLYQQYVCTIAKTASDFRSGYNIVHQICLGLTNPIYKDPVSTTNEVYVL